MNNGWNEFLTQIQTMVAIYWRPTLLALIILVVAHFVAKAVKWAIAKMIDRIPFFARRETLAVGAARRHSRLGERIGEVGYWVVWLIGLIAALNQFGPQMASVIEPLNAMERNFLAYVPNVVGATLIFVIGFALATIVRRMVEAVVQAVDLDRRLIAAGVTRAQHGPGLARMFGILVFTLIIIPVAIAALDVLDIQAISQPAERMLNNILLAIPNVLGAALILFIAYVIGRWVGTLAEEGLQSIGFDEGVRALTSAEHVQAGLRRSDISPDADSVKADASGFPPSRMVGFAVLAGIMLFSAIEAARLLGFVAMSDMLNEVLQLATRVLFGAVLIAIGVVIANILAAAAARGDKASAEIMPVLVRWGIILLSAAVGLRFMGLANDIIELAFGLILGAVAVAVAIAFGIGGRDAAKRMLDRWTQ